MQCLWGLLSSCLNQVSSLAASVRVCEVQRPSLHWHSHCLSEVLRCAAKAPLNVGRRPAPARPLWGVTWRRVQLVWPPRELDWLVPGSAAARGTSTCTVVTARLLAHAGPISTLSNHLRCFPASATLCSVHDDRSIRQRSDEKKPGPVTLRVASSRRLSSSTTSSSSSSSSPSYPRLPHARPRH